MDDFIGQQSKPSNKIQRDRIFFGDFGHSKGLPGNSSVICVQIIIMIIIIVVGGGCGDGEIWIVVITSLVWGSDGVVTHELCPKKTLVCRVGLRRGTSLDCPPRTPSTSKTIAASEWGKDKFVADGADKLIKARLHRTNNTTHSHRHKTLCVVPYLKRVLST